MSIWDDAAATVTEEERRQQATGEMSERERMARDYPRVLDTCRSNHTRIQALIDDYLARNPPTVTGDTYIIQFKNPKNWDDILEVHKDGRWLLWRTGRMSKVLYLSSSSLNELESKGYVPDEVPFPDARFRIGEECIATSLYKELRRHSLI